MGQAHLAQMVAAARAKGLLTDAQRAQVAQWPEGHEEQSGGPRGGHEHGPGHEHHSDQ
jgi:hypothetical protein